MGDCLCAVREAFGPVVIGILHPGEMGAAVGGDLVDRGHEVLWVRAGRSEATADRAVAAGLRPVEAIEELKGRCEIVLSICPPAAALDVARRARGLGGVYVEANAVSPSRSREVLDAIDGPGVDGSIIGPPPRDAGTTRLYLSGAHADEVAAAFAGARTDARVLRGDDPFAASALKMAYAGWTKGSAALLLTVADAAASLGVADALAEEWALSQPELAERLPGARRSAAAKGWRWEEEMRQIALTLRDAGQPGGFHDAAAEVYGDERRG